MIAAILAGTAAHAALISCNATPLHHVKIADDLASACLASGYEIGLGSMQNDPFLTSSGGSQGYELASQSGGNNPFDISYAHFNVPILGGGAWSFDPSFWDTHAFGALGLRFEVGRWTDTWFVFELLPSVSSGLFAFVSLLGGELSQVSLYGIAGPGENPPVVAVAEPETIFLMLAGLGLAAMATRRGHRRPEGLAA